MAPPPGEWAKIHMLPRKLVNNKRSGQPRHNLLPWGTNCACRQVHAWQLLPSVTCTCHQHKPSICTRTWWFVFNQWSSVEGRGGNVRMRGASVLKNGGELLVTQVWLRKKEVWWTKTSDNSGCIHNCHNDNCSRNLDLPTLAFIILTNFGVQKKRSVVYLN